ncbi:MAG: DUF177 domain-containing protein [Bdellovibrionales bacterium]|nr:DUF177 domain-containing protein [Bdellovibrionales bacterium]
MRIYLSELSDIPKIIDSQGEEPWVKAALSRLDELTPEESLKFQLKKAAGQKSGSAPNRPVDLHLSLSKVDQVVVLDGKIKTELTLICSRCANPFSHPIKAPLAALYTRDPAMAGIAHLKEDSESGRVKPVGQNHGVARHAHDYHDEEKLNASSHQLEIAYLDQDFMDLTQTLSEQVQLEIPLAPLCKEDCKGMCANCGADLNTGRCACAKIAKNSPFSALKNLKLPKA